MIELGKKQKLTVVKSVDFGVYLAEDMHADAKNRVLLPSKQVPEGTKEGDSIEVFIYKDSQDRLIATTKEPKLQVGQTAVLKVSQVTRIGAFLDWGLEKDLLLPYHEQTLKVREGEDVLVALYIDKSSRLCATMKVYHYLSTRTPYVVGDMVKGRVYPPLFLRYPKSMPPLSLPPSPATLPEMAAAKLNAVFLSLTLVSSPSTTPQGWISSFLSCALKKLLYSCE